MFCHVTFNATVVSRPSTVGAECTQWWWRPIDALGRLEREETSYFRNDNPSIKKKKNHCVVIEIERFFPVDIMQRFVFCSIVLPLSNHSVSLLDFWASLWTFSIRMNVMWASSNRQKRSATVSSHEPDVLNGLSIWLIRPICCLVNELSKLFGIALICSILKFCSWSLDKDFKNVGDTRGSACLGKKLNSSGDKEPMSAVFQPAKRSIFLSHAWSSFLTSNSAKWTKDRWSKEIAFINILHEIKHRRWIVHVRFEWTLDVREDRQIRSNQEDRQMECKKKHGSTHLTSSGAMRRRICSSTAQRILPAFSRNEGVKRFSLPKDNCANDFN